MGRLLDTYEAADCLSVSKAYLDSLRSTGGGPEYIKIGRRMVRYRRSALDKWVDSHGTRRHTTQREPDAVRKASLTRIRLKETAP